MVRRDRDRLKGIVEIDEAYVGGIEEGARGRYTETKAIVAIAVEILEDDRLGRVRMAPVPGVSSKALQGVVREVVEPGTSILTDGWSGYSGPSAHGYDHVVFNQSASPSPARVFFPESLGWLRCSSAGSSERTKAAFLTRICRTSSTNSPLASTGETLALAGCCSSGSSSKHPRRDIHQRRSFTKALGRGPRRRKRHVTHSST
jgi:transposase-like protein